MGLEEKLAQLQSWDAGKDVLEGVELHPFQIVDVLKMIYAKRAVVRYDTGTGKTLLAAAAMKFLWREDPTRRFLMFIKKDQMIQTPKKLSDYTGRLVIASCAAQEDVQEVFETGRFLNYPLLLLTHECLNNRIVMKVLRKEREKFCGVVIDEAHELNNKGFAQSADVMAGLVSRFEYCWALTATPIVTSLLQLAKLACLVDAKRYPNYAQLKKRLSQGTFEIRQDPIFFINRTAEELGRFSEYVGHLVWVKAMKHQKEKVGGFQLMSLCKGKGATRQAETLVALIKKQGEKRGLVYVQQHAVREWILPFLREAGIRFECINGRVVKERSAILDRFNQEKSLDVIVTSVTTAVDADCDYVVFYEFTVELKQMIGRADRGLNGKTVDIYFVVTRGSQEPLYFMHNIVDRSEIVKRTLGVKYRELEDVAAEVEEVVMLDQD